jgi:solute carrier family 25 citrate transporter 1
MMAQAKAPPDAPRYHGFFDALMRIPAQEGLLAMYKGLLPRLMRIAPGQAIVWMVNDQVRSWHKRYKPYGCLVLFWRAVGSS